MGSVPNSALGASSDGSVIVGAASSPDSQPRPFRWTAQSGMVAIDAIISGEAADVSSDGSVIVGYGFGVNGELNERAWRWTAAGGVVDLGKLPETPATDLVFMSATAVSGDGAVVVGIQNNNTSSTRHAFRWTQADGMVELGDLPGGPPFGGESSFAHDISTNGQVIVGAGTVDEGTEAVRWTQAGGLVSIGDLPGGLPRGRALATNADGSIIVGLASDDTLEELAFIWDAPSGMRSLRQVLIDAGATGLTGWRLDRATGISDDGRTIVGVGVNPLGIQQGWIATLGSTPACPADFNGADGLSVQDIFDFLNAWFAGSPAADINGGGLSVQDIFDFLNAWFAGC
jgi:probable HAF family extracellular repeat protein